MRVEIGKRCALRYAVTNRCCSKPRPSPKKAQGKGVEVEGTQVSLACGEGTARSGTPVAGGGARRAAEQRSRATVAPPGGEAGRGAAQP